ncbi:MAG: tetraacyldisaccharide 4'-kinase [Proteobacteria bacterium]|nr:tetraacyldisaccharide 4'-kinase [Pseudomonadota bacterium]
MEQRLTALWYRESAGFSLLAPLGWLYAGVMALRRAAYAAGVLPTHRAGKPVIVVGNLTVGGTGKTPLVAWLAQQLSLTGLRVGIVSRGYGRSGDSPESVHAESSWREVGDEPMLLAGLTGCEVVVARDRFAGAQKLVALGVDVVIADDGLQHLRLARDCEIVVIDGARGFGNRRLLPAGPLREPSSRVADADIVVVNGTPEHASLRSGRPDGLQMSLSGGEVHRVDGLAAPEPLERFRGRRVHAVAGIGNPQRFFRDLQAAGLEIIEHPFADHHPFTRAELTFGDDLPVLMTQKDAVRCREIADARLWYVPVVAHFTESQGRELLDRVARALAPGD